MLILRFSRSAGNFSVNAFFADTFKNHLRFSSIMEVLVQERSKNSLIIEIKGADHTLCNLLKAELSNDESVTIATYRMGHPLVATPVFIIQTDGSKDPDKALLDAVAKLKKKNSAFFDTIKSLR